MSSGNPFLVVLTQNMLNMFFKFDMFLDPRPKEGPIKSLLSLHLSVSLSVCLSVCRFSHKDLSGRGSIALPLGLAPGKEDGWKN